jgi:hypothetical protein
MKNGDAFQLRSAFLMHTALVVGFMLTLSLGSVANWLHTSTLGSALTPLNSSTALSHNK